VNDARSWSWAPDPASARPSQHTSTTAVTTPILSDFEQTMGKDILDMCRATVGRHATVDDIVPVIAFLGSPEARWINGADIQVDAGFIASMTAGAPIQL
jgi:NAD(P)-dependent dehydrogenase (short-subunit alcohol dehydrogenase family)